MAYSLYLEATAIKKQATKLSRHWLWILPSFFLTHALWAKHPGGGAFSPLRSLNPGQWQDLRQNRVVALSTVATRNNRQKLRYYSAGLHPRSCAKALIKMSRYESYRDFISFITHSRYSDQTKKIYLRFSHVLLPYPLTLYFSIARITRPGIYPFVFPIGILKGLKGEIQVAPYGRRCLMEVSANWEGKTTGINDLVFEVFSITLGRLGIKKMFRVSSI